LQAKDAIFLEGKNLLNISSDDHKVSLFMTLDSYFYMSLIDLFYRGVEDAFNGSSSSEVEDVAHFIGDRYLGLIKTSALLQHVVTDSSFSQENIHEVKNFIFN